MSNNLGEIKPLLQVITRTLDFDCDYLYWQNVSIQGTTRNPLRFFSQANRNLLLKRAALPWCLSTKVVLFGDTERVQEESPFAIIPYYVLGIISTWIFMKCTDSVLSTYDKFMTLLLCLV